MFKILRDNDFVNARIIIYSMLLVVYIFLAYFSNFKCIGCPLCGMTRAIKSLMVLDFTAAFEFNNNVWIFCIFIPIVMIDIVYIIYVKYSKKVKDRGNLK